MRLKEFEIVTLGIVSNNFLTQLSVLTEITSSSSLLFACSIKLIDIDLSRCILSFFFHFDSHGQSGCPLDLVDTLRSGVMKFAIVSLT